MLFMHRHATPTKKSTMARKEKLHANATLNFSAQDTVYTVHRHCLHLEPSKPGKCPSETSAHVSLYGGEGVSCIVVVYCCFLSKFQKEPKSIAVTSDTSKY
jgi:hypothetical protein